MEWITENWIWLLLGGAMIGMHLFGHGKHGHGGGGGCCGGGHGNKDPEKGKAVTPAEH